MVVVTTPTAVVGGGSMASRHAPQAWPPVTAHEIEGLHLTQPSIAIGAYMNTAATNEEIF